MDKNEITPTHIRKMLQNWDSIYDLGKTREAELEIVCHKLEHLGLADSLAGRGMALKMLLKEGIERLKPNSGPPDVEDRRWRPYLIISARYCQGRHPDWIMIDLFISQRTFYRELQAGLAKIASYLTQLEVETTLKLNQIEMRTGGGEHATPGLQKSELYSVRMMGR